MTTRIIEILHRYPIITGTIVACTIVGAAVGVLFLPEQWALARKVAGGALGGAGCGLIVTAPRILG